MSVVKKFALTIFLINIVVMAIYLNKFESRADLLTDMQDQADGFIDEGGKQSKKFDTAAITDNFKGLGQILTMVGAGVMVAVTSIMGIKYLVSPPDKQAALKQQLIGLVVAGVVIFGAYGIWSAVVKVASKF